MAKGNVRRDGSGKPQGNRHPQGKRPPPQQTERKPRKLHDKTKREELISYADGVVVCSETAKTMFFNGAPQGKDNQPYWQEQGNADGYLRRFRNLPESFRPGDEVTCNIKVVRVTDHFDDGSKKVTIAVTGIATDKRPTHSFLEFRAKRPTLAPKGSQVFEFERTGGIMLCRLA
ncbi:MAG TPA: hypothetical protein VF696_01650 [Candidatus Paceibacterota bacterium]|jgi:hypothetical protein